MKIFNIETKEDLANHLKVHSVEVAQVLADRRKYYRSFEKRKADGTSRLIFNPQGPLKLLQQKVKSHILDLVSLPDCVHGGVRFRPVMSNARPHIGKQIVFRLDIKNFYPSVEPRIVRVIFATLGFGPEAAEVLTDVTTWDNQLPQGVATSTGLANLSMFRVDCRLQKLAWQQGFDYTRWIDDLTLSGHRRLLDFTRLIKKIVVEEGFSVNPGKVQTMHSGERQVVTGICVNRKLNLSREDRHIIRQRVLQLRHSSAAEGLSLDKVRGQVSWLSQVNPLLGARLLNRLLSSKNFRPRN